MFHIISLVTGCIGGLGESISIKIVPAISPDNFVSDINPQIHTGRLGHFNEFAGLIGNLCSNVAAFVNGAKIVINGGQHIE